MTLPIIVGATHYSIFYGEMIYYRKIEFKKYNSVIDHPTKCWQNRYKYEYFENGGWVCVGSGFSDRRLKPL